MGNALRRADEWSVLSLLLPAHVATFWQVEVPGWNAALPAIAELARELVSTGELVDLAASARSPAEVAEALWDRLGACLVDVERLASLQPEPTHLEHDVARSD